MIQQSYHVENISCAHCTNTIESELSALEEVQTVTANKESKVVTVEVNASDDLSTVNALLEEIGFPGKPR